MRKEWILAGLALAIAGLLVWAWIDGGREPLYPITTPVSLPVVAR